MIIFFGRSNIGVSPGKRFCYCPTSYYVSMGRLVWYDSVRFKVWHVLSLIWRHQTPPVDAL